MKCKRNGPTATPWTRLRGIGELIRNTKYTFSLSTLTFETHDEVGSLDMVRTFLAPALKELHDRAPEGGLYPLVRVVYSDSDAVLDTDVIPDWDEPEEVYEDLTSVLSDEVSTDPRDWHVSVAVGIVGKVPVRAWNHSKIAVRDYREAIVGGINWSPDYLLPVAIDGENHDPVGRADRGSPPRSDGQDRCVRAVGPGQPRPAPRRLFGVGDGIGGNGGRVARRSSRGPRSGPSSDQYRALPPRNGAVSRAAISLPGSGKLHLSHARQILHGR